MLLMSDHDFRLVFMAVGVIVAAIILSSTVRWLIHGFFSRNSAILRADPTRYNFLKNAASFIIFTLALILIIYMVPELRSLGATLFAGAGIFAAVLALASQQAFSNIISGIFIVMFKPFRVGDIIEVSGQRRGRVEDITLRHVVIRDFQNQRIIIPNTVISAETIINANITDERVKRHLVYPIGFSSNIDLAFAIITDEALKHPLTIDGRTTEEVAANQPVVKCRVLGFGESSVNIRADVWAKNPDDAFELQCDLNRSIKLRFDREGIEIPFPHRTVFIHQKNETDHG